MRLRLFFCLNNIFFTDLLTVSETAAEPPQDEGSSLNSPRNLALEATFINHNFSQQVLKGQIFKNYVRLKLSFETD